MSSKDVNRSVRSQNHSRAAGDAPNMGRVGKMPGTGLPKGERRRRKRGEGTSKSKVNQRNRFAINVWSAFLAIVAVISLGVAIWFGLAGKRKVSEVAAVLPDPVEQPAQRTKIAAPADAEAVQFVQDGLAVRDPARVWDFFRKGDSTGDDIIGFLAGLEEKDGTLGSLDWIGNMDANDLQIEGVLVNFKGTKPRNRVALLTPGEEGDWRIDFDAFARTTRPALKDLIEGRAEKSRARVYLAAENYFNGPYSNDNLWSCYGLASPDEEDVLLGYCKKGTPQDKALKWMLSKDSKMTRATIEVIREEGALARQVVISTVVAEDWLAGEKPFDETFK